MHDPSKPELIARFTKQGGRGQRKWAVWYVKLKCPLCLREFTRLQNTSRGRGFVCTGTDKLTATS